MTMMSNIKVSPVGFIVIFLLVGALVLYFERTWSSSDDEKSTDDLTVEISLRELLSASIELAERGGEEVINVMKEKKLNEKSKGETREGANNPVTDGDMRSHEVIMHGFEVSFPKSLLVSVLRGPTGFCIATVNLFLSLVGMTLDHPMIFYGLMYPSPK